MHDQQSIFWVTKTRPRKNKGAVTEDGPTEPLTLFQSPVILMDKISRLIYATIEEKLTGTPQLAARYNPKRAAILCQALAAEIKRRVKELRMRSYRVVAMLSIVPKQEQGVSYKMALHGDHLVDFFGNSKYETGFAFILGTVYLVYKH